MGLKAELIANFDPNGPGTSGHLFGLPFPEQCAELIVVAAPWEATVSAGSGTALAPQAIREASLQVDLFMRGIPDAWQLGLSMLPIEKRWLARARETRLLAEQHIRSLEAGERGNNAIVSQVNEACKKMVFHIKETTSRYLGQNKLVGVLGGDHSVPLGFLQALGERHDQFGILQIDAHADLRACYQGFVYSHASIMHNAVKLPALARLVQVGIRDYCQEEHEAIENSAGKIIAFYDEALKTAAYKGKTWASQCDAIVACLPHQVYISFDIDGLDPTLCPNTGTPVPGGFDFHQVAMLIGCIVKSGRKIIGFDLSEVAPGGANHWDANVGARLLYLLCNWMAASQGRLSYQR